MTDEDRDASPDGAAAGEPDGDVAAGEPDGDGAEAFPTLQDEFAELSPELRRSMLGKPAQLISGLLIGALILVALLFGVTSLAKNGSADGSATPAPSVSPSGWVLAEPRA